MTAILGRLRRPGLAVILIMAAPLLGGALMTPAAAGTGAGGTTASARGLVPVPGQSSDLFGVICPSSSNCWAVGRYLDTGGAYFNQILHWNGTAWSLVSAPNPGGTANGDFNELASVGCTSASNCWAVGNDIAANGPKGSSNEALHWNGAKWSLVTTPQPGTADGLGSVRCTSASNCWAVGSYTNASGATVNQALHWTGAKWSLVPTPDPGGTASLGQHSELDGVGCTSASNCWAAGYDTKATNGTAPDLNQILRWNGAKWSLAPSPDPGGTAAGDVSTLSGVSCTSSSSCWAVGDYGSNSPRTRLNQALRWNGSSWSLVSTPDPDGTGGTNVLSAVTCTSAGDCWAVGDYGSISGGTGVVVNQALHWNGSAWSLVSTPDPGGLLNDDSNTLFAVRCVSTASCLAVGGVSPGGTPDLNQALFWNGSAWSAG